VAVFPGDIDVFYLFEIVAVADVAMAYFAANSFLFNAR